MWPFTADPPTNLSSPPTGTVPVSGANPGMGKAPNTDPSFFDFLWATMKGDPAALDSWKEGAKIAGRGAIDTIKDAADATGVTDFFVGIKTFLIWFVVVSILGVILFYFLRAKATRIGAS